MSSAGAEPFTRAAAAVSCAPLNLASRLKRSSARLTVGQPATASRIAPPFSASCRRGAATSHRYRSALSSSIAARTHFGTALSVVQRPSPPAARVNRGGSRSTRLRWSGDSGSVVSVSAMRMPLPSLPHHFRSRSLSQAWSMREHGWPPCTKEKASRSGSFCRHASTAPTSPSTRHNACALPS